MTEQLQLLIDRLPPQVENMNIYANQICEWSGHKWELYIIGSSHYIHRPNFHEVFSCKPVEPADGSSVPVFAPEVGGRKEVIDHNFHHMDVSVYIDVLEEDEAIIPEGTLRYEFEPHGITAIRLRDDEQAYETWHSYPEYGQVVYTETTFHD